MNKLKLVKTTEFKNCNFKDSLNTFLKQNPTILKNINYEYISYINVFLNTLDKNPNIDLSLFYENLKTLTIKEKNNFNRLIFFPTSNKAAYKLKKNQIQLLKNNYDFYILHELLHCASFKKIDNGYCTGFYYSLAKTMIGRALNEEYTAILEKRYFNENANQNIYTNVRFLVDKMETIIEKQNMEKLYFTANLNGLINEFIKYGKSKEEIVFFIDELDYLYYSLGDPESKILCQDVLYHVTNFLIDCYKKKCSIEKNNNPSLNEFINSFQKQIKSNGISYNFLSDDFMKYQRNELKQYYISAVSDFKRNYIR